MSQEESTKIDIASLSQEEQETLAKENGKFVGATLNEALGKIKAKLDTSGLEFHVLWEMTPKGTAPGWLSPEWHKSQLEDFVKTAKQLESKKTTKKQKTAKKTATKKKTTTSRKKATKPSKVKTGDKIESNVDS